MNTQDSSEAHGYREPVDGVKEREALENLLKTWDMVCNTNGWDPDHYVQARTARKVLATPPPSNNVREAVSRETVEAWGHDFAGSAMAGQKFFDAAVDRVLAALAHGYREPVEGEWVDVEESLPYCSRCRSFGFGKYCSECGAQMTNFDSFGNNPLCEMPSATPPPSTNVREPAQDECGWTRDEWSESWSAGCGAEWIFPDGGPAENGMKFCPSCGKPVSLAALSDKGGV